MGPDGGIARRRSRHESNTDGCRDERDLDNGNVYSRARCNANGWCAYAYDYFFEKDVGDRLCIGHRFDWEHIVAWTRHGAPRIAAVSAHGRYHARLWPDVPTLNGSHHVQAVYHEDGAVGTHCFRWSRGASDEPPENHKRAWCMSHLVSWDGFPSRELRDRLAGHDFGAAHMAITDAALAANLRRSVDGVRDRVPDFEFQFDHDALPP